MGKLDKLEKRASSEAKQVSKEAVEAAPKEKVFVAVKTIKIRAGNGDFQLIAGEQIPSGISKPFVQSLLSSKLIK